ncbi:MAG: hypothetical protein PVI07_15185 [Anaerolineae bacterium]|jgi:hypothetical protein
MPNEAIQEVLSEPIGEMLKHVGRAIAEAQRALDEYSMATDVELSDLRESVGYDLRATWYHLPETEIEMKMSISMSWEEQQKGGKKLWRRFVHAAPLNASYKNLFDYDAAGTSVVKTRIVSIPPAPAIEAE